MRTASMPRRRRRRPASRHRRLDIRRAHQRLADQHRVDAGRRQLGELLRAAEAGLGDDGRRRPGSPASSSNVRRTSTSSVVRSRLLMPMISAPAATATSSSAPSWTSTSDGQAQPLAPARAARPASAGSSAATISRIASAPAASASSTCNASTMKSLRSSGSELAARARRRSSSEPPNLCRLGEDRERRRPAPLVGADDLLERQVLPDRAGARRAALVLGDQRQSRPASAAQERSPVAPRPIARRPPRHRRLDARARPPPRHRLPGRLEDRRQPVHAPRQLLRAGDEALERLRGRAGVDRPPGRPHPVGQGVGAPAGVDRRRRRSAPPAPAPVPARRRRSRG